MSDMNMSSNIPPELLARLSGDVEAFHSNSYAKDAQGNRLGSTSASSFDARANIEKNRQSIRSYRDSAIGGGFHMKRGEVASPARGTLRQPLQISRPALPVAKPTTFREPPTRPYNPYS